MTPTYVPHAFPEQQVDLGEASLNYAAAGPEAAPALVLIPGQTESWWGYEPVMQRLAPHYRLYALDLRGQGRSSRTPGRYSLDNLGGDVVHFLYGVVKRPAVVCGLSSGGLVAAWLSAFAPPGLLRGAYWEDPPFFSSELTPSCGPGIRQSGPGQLFRLMGDYLGPQWRVGHWQGFVEACARELPPWMRGWTPRGAEPPQRLKEYDPEWSIAFWQGTMAVTCPHERLLAQVRVPVLYTHHSHGVDKASGWVQGAATEPQAAQACRLARTAGHAFTFRSLPKAPHALHEADPDLYVRTLAAWLGGLA